MPEVIPKVRAAAIRRTRKELRKDPVRFIQSRANLLHIETHYRKDPALLNNVISGKKFGDSRFINEHTMYDAISVALDENMEDLYDYLHDPERTDDFIIECDVGDYIDTVGTGFVMDSKKKDTFLSYEQKVNACETSGIGMVIRKSNATECGYCIVSAFPATHPLSLPNAVKIQKDDLSPILKHTWTYQDERNNDVWRLAARAACRDNSLNGMHVTYVPKSYTCNEMAILYRGEPGPDKTVPSAMFSYDRQQKLVCKFGTVGITDGPAGLKRTTLRDRFTEEEAKEKFPEFFEEIQKVKDTMAPVGPKPTPYQPFPDQKSPETPAVKQTSQRGPPPPSPGQKNPPKNSCTASADTPEKDESISY